MCINLLHTPIKKLLQSLKSFFLQFIITLTIDFSWKKKKKEFSLAVTYIKEQWEILGWWADTATHLHAAEEHFHAASASSAADIQWLLLFNTSAQQCNQSYLIFNTNLIR